MEPAMSVAWFIFSAFLNIEAWVLLVLNILCLYCIVRGRLLTTSSNPIYLIIGYNLIIDSGGILIDAVFIGPSMYFGADFFNESVTTFISIFFWFTSSCIQIILALNRLAVVVFPHLVLFTHRRIYIILIFSSTFALFLCVSAHILIPCCRIVLEPVTNGYTFIDISRTNYASYLVYLPVNLTRSSVCFVSYITLIYYTSKIKSCAKNTNMMHEIRLCFQCASMFFVYTAAWFIYLVFPQSSSEVRTIMAMVPIAYLGTNAMVYLFFNRDIKSQLRSMKETSTWVKTTIVPN